MKIHHLNAGTLCPASAALVNGRGGLFSRARLVCHVLLIERRDSLAVVDTGLGLGDVREPERLGDWRARVRPVLSETETVFAQVSTLGFKPGDVQDILVTHLDRDHCGGINDFPWARVHVHEREHRAAVLGQSPWHPGRYLQDQWSGGTHWALLPNDGEDWFGFKGVRPLASDEEILAIPLEGHTAGHCGIAVRTPDGWLLHAGDSHFHHGQRQTPPAKTPLALRYFQRRGDVDRTSRQWNQDRLRDLQHRRGAEVKIVCSHDPWDFDRCIHAAAGALGQRSGSVPGAASAALPL